MTPPSTFSEVLATLSLRRVTAASFVGEQLAAPFNHILGGHVAAQSLIAAAHTVPGRSPHSMHAYFLRAGDAREPVDYDVVELQDGRTFAARRITARQDGQVLAETMASFKATGAQPDDVEYQPAMPTVPAPDELPPPPAHFAESAYDGRWSSLRWFERRVIEADVAPPSRSRIWWRPGGEGNSSGAGTVGIAGWYSTSSRCAPVALNDAIVSASTCASCRAVIRRAAKVRPSCSSTTS